MFLFSLYALKNVFYGILCEGPLFFPPYYNLLSKYLISTFLNHLLFNLKFMFALNLDTIYFFEFEFLIEGVKNVKKWIVVMHD